MTDLCAFEMGEDAVVGADKVVATGPDQERAARRADAGVDDSEVDGAFGKVAPGLIEKECALSDGEGRDVVGDVDDLSVWGDGGDDTFHYADEMVCQAEVCEESDHRCPLE